MPDQDIPIIVSYTSTHTFDTLSSPITFCNAIPTFSMDRLHTLASSCCCSQGYAAVKRFDSMSMWYQRTGGFDFRFMHCLCDIIDHLRNNFSIAQVSITFVIGISLPSLPIVTPLQIFSKNLEKGVVLIRRRICVRFLVVFLAFPIIIILQRENLSLQEPEGLLFDHIPGGCNHL